MNFISDTRKQHFLPQVEQRLNASNPHASQKNQKIFSFEVIDREKCELRVENELGRLISENLAIQDLFSFDVSSDKKSRMNFEKLFMRYEKNVKSNTESLLRKLEVWDYDTSNELINLFAAKLLNFARNPYSITKVLNTFGVLTNYVPTTPSQQVNFEKILNGRKPHQAHLCKELGITDSDYEKWLRMLFMFFIEYGEGELNMFEGMVKSMFESKQHVIAACHRGNGLLLHRCQLPCFRPCFQHKYELRWSRCL